MTLKVSNSWQYLSPCVFFTMWRTSADTRILCCNGWQLGISEPLRPFMLRINPVHWKARWIKALKRYIRDSKVSGRITAHTLCWGQKHNVAVLLVQIPLHISTVVRCEHTEVAGVQRDAEKLTPSVCELTCVHSTFPHNWEMEKLLDDSDLLAAFETLSSMLEVGWQNLIPRMTLLLYLLMEIIIDEKSNVDLIM